MPEETKAATKPVLVGILMGSDSDWPKIRGVSDALHELNISHEINVMSAHRTPGRVAEYAQNAASRGLKVVIAAAGGAAHLAGTVAAHTILPVIGIPVATEVCGGLDSLLATVQMPGDVPVATVGLGTGGPRNAGLLAAQILALGDPDLRRRFEQFKKRLSEKIEQKNTAFKESLKPSPLNDDDYKEYNYKGYNFL